MVVGTFSLCFTSMCSLKCMHFSFDIYIGFCDESAFTHLVTLLCYGTGGWTLRCVLPFFSMLFQFLKVDISFVSAMCRELFKCCNLIQRAIYFSFVAMA